MANPANSTSSSPAYHAIIRQRRPTKNGGVVDFVSTVTALSSLRPERVAYASDGVDQLDIRTFVHFVAQIADVDIDQVRFAEKIRTPHAIEYLVARVDFVRIHEQKFEE